MPRNVSELKSGGGGQFLCCPPTLKNGGDASPRPPPIDARACACVYNTVFVSLLHFMKAYAHVCVCARVGARARACVRVCFKGA